MSQESSVNEEKLKNLDKPVDPENNKPDDDGEPDGLVIIDLNVEENQDSICEPEPELQKPGSHGKKILMVVAFLLILAVISFGFAVFLHYLGQYNVNLRSLASLIRENPDEYNGFGNIVNTTEITATGAINKTYTLCTEMDNFHDCCDIFLNTEFKDTLRWCITDMLLDFILGKNNSDTLTEIEKQEYVKKTRDSRSTKSEDKHINNLYIILRNKLNHDAKVGERLRDKRNIAGESYYNEYVYQEYPDDEHMVFFDINDNSEEQYYNQRKIRPSRHEDLPERKAQINWDTHNPRESLFFHTLDARNYPEEYNPHVQQTIPNSRNRNSPYNFRTYWRLNDEGRRPTSYRENTETENLQIRDRRVEHFGELNNTNQGKKLQQSATSNYDTEGTSKPQTATRNYGDADTKAEFQSFLQSHINSGIHIEKTTAENELLHEMDQDVNGDVYTENQDHRLADSFVGNQLLQVNGQREPFGIKLPANYKQIDKSSEASQIDFSGGQKKASERENSMAQILSDKEGKPIENREKEIAASTSGLQYTSTHIQNKPNYLIPPIGNDSVRFENKPNFPLGDLRDKAPGNELPSDGELPINAGNLRERSEIIGDIVIAQYPQIFGQKKSSEIKLPISYIQTGTSELTDEIGRPNLQEGSTKSSFPLTEGRNTGTEQENPFRNSRGDFKNGDENREFLKSILGQQSPTLPIQNKPYDQLAPVRHNQTTTSKSINETTLLERPKKPNFPTLSVEHKESAITRPDDQLRISEGNPIEGKENNEMIESIVGEQYPQIVAQNKSSDLKLPIRHIQTGTSDLIDESERPSSSGGSGGSYFPLMGGTSKGTVQENPVEQSRNSRGNFQNGDENREISESILGQQSPTLTIQNKPYDQLPPVRHNQTTTSKSINETTLLERPKKPNFPTLSVEHKESAIIRPDDQLRISEGNLIGGKENNAMIESIVGEQYPQIVAQNKSSDLKLPIRHIQTGTSDLIDENERPSSSGGSGGSYFPLMGGTSKGTEQENPVEQSRNSRGDFQNGDENREISESILGQQSPTLTIQNKPYDQLPPVRHNQTTTSKSINETTLLERPKKPNFPTLSVEHKESAIIRPDDQLRISEGNLIGGKENNAMIESIVGEQYPQIVAQNKSSDLKLPIRHIQTGTSDLIDESERPSSSGGSGGSYFPLMGGTSKGTRQENPVEQSRNSRGDFQNGDENREISESILGQQSPTLTIQNKPYDQLPPVRHNQTTTSKSINETTLLERPKKQNFPTLSVEHKESAIIRPDDQLRISEGNLIGGKENNEMIESIVGEQYPQIVAQNKSSDLKLPIRHIQTGTSDLIDENERPSSSGGSGGSYFPLMGGTSKGTEQENPVEQSRNSRGDFQNGDENREISESILGQQSPTLTIQNKPYDQLPPVRHNQTTTSKSINETTLLERPKKPNFPTLSVEHKESAIIRPDDQLRISEGNLIGGKENNEMIESIVGEQYPQIVAQNKSSDLKLPIRHIQTGTSDLIDENERPSSSGGSGGSYFPLMGGSSKGTEQENPVEQSRNSRGDFQNGDENREISESILGQQSPTLTIQNKPYDQLPPVRHNQTITSKSINETTLLERPKKPNFPTLSVEHKESAIIRPDDQLRISEGNLIEGKENNEMIESIVGEQYPQIVAQNKSSDLKLPIRHIQTGTSDLIDENERPSSSGGSGGSYFPLMGGSSKGTEQENPVEQSRNSRGDFQNGDENREISESILGQQSPTLTIQNKPYDQLPPVRLNQTTTSKSINETTLLERPKKPNFPTLSVEHKESAIIRPDDQLRISEGNLIEGKENNEMIESIVGEQHPQIVAQNKSSDLKLPIRHIQTGTSDLIDENERPSSSGGSGGSYFPLMGGSSKGTEQENPVEQSRNSRGDFQNGDENREISESILGQQSPTLTIQNKPYDQLPPVRHNQTTTSKSINETTLLERPKKPNFPTLSVEHKESAIIRPDDQLRISEGNLIEGKENNEMIESIVGEQYPQIVAQNKSSDLKLPIRHIQTGTSDLIDENERPSSSGGSGGSYFPLMGGSSKGTEQENPVEQSRNSRGDFQNGDENREISESILGQQSPTLTIQNKPYDQLPPVRHNQTTTSKSINETTLLERPKKPNFPTLSVEHKESAIIRPDDQLRISEGNLIEGKENNEMIESIVGEQHPQIVAQNKSSDLKLPIRHIQTGTSDLIDENERPSSSGGSGGSYFPLMGGSSKGTEQENPVEQSRNSRGDFQNGDENREISESILGQQSPTLTIQNKPYDQLPPVRHNQTTTSKSINETTLLERPKKPNFPTLSVEHKESAIIRPDDQLRISEGNLIEGKENNEMIESIVGEQYPQIVAQNKSSDLKLPIRHIQTGTSDLIDENERPSSSGGSGGSYFPLMGGSSKGTEQENPVEQSRNSRGDFQNGDENREISESILGQQSPTLTIQNKPYDQLPPVRHNQTTTSKSINETTLLERPKKPNFPTLSVEHKESAIIRPDDQLRISEGNLIGGKENNEMIESIVGEQYPQIVAQNKSSDLKLPIRHIQTGTSDLIDENERPSSSGGSGGSYFPLMGGSSKGTEQENPVEQSRNSRGDFQNGDENREISESILGQQSPTLTIQNKPYDQLPPVRHNQTTTSKSINETTLLERPKKPNFPTLSVEHKESAIIRPDDQLRISEGNLIEGKENNEMIESIVGEQHPQIVAQNKSSDLKLPIRHIQTGTSDLIDESERPSSSGGSGGSYFPLTGGTSKGTEQENPVEQSRNSRGDFQNGDENREISESILGQQSPTLTIQNKPYDQLPPVRHNQTTTSKSINETTLLERPKKPNFPTLSVEHKESAIIRPDDQLRISEGNLIGGKENNEMIESIVGEQYPQIVAQNKSSDLKLPIRHIQTGTSDLIDENERPSSSRGSGGSYFPLMGGSSKGTEQENPVEQSRNSRGDFQNGDENREISESILGQQSPTLTIQNKPYDQLPPVRHNQTTTSKSINETTLLERPKKPNFPTLSVEHKESAIIRPDDQLRISEGNLIEGKENNEMIESIVGEQHPQIVAQNKSSDLKLPIRHIQTGTSDLIDESERPSSSGGSGGSYFPLMGGSSKGTEQENPVEQSRNSRGDFQNGDENREISESILGQQSPTLTIQNKPYDQLPPVRHNQTTTSKSINETTLLERPKKPNFPTLSVEHKESAIIRPDDQLRISEGNLIEGKENNEMIESIVGEQYPQIVAQNKSSDLKLPIRHIQTGTSDLIDESQRPSSSGGSGGSYFPLMGGTSKGTEQDNPVEQSRNSRGDFQNGDENREISESILGQQSPTLTIQNKPYDQLPPVRHNQTTTSKSINETTLLERPKKPNFPTLSVEHKESAIIRPDDQLRISEGNLFEGKENNEMIESIVGEQYPQIVAQNKSSDLKLPIRHIQTGTSDLIDESERPSSSGGSGGSYFPLMGGTSKGTEQENPVEQSRNSRGDFQNGDENREISESILGQQSPTLTIQNKPYDQLPPVRHNQTTTSKSINETTLLERPKKPNFPTLSVEHKESAIIRPDDQLRISEGNLIEGKENNEMIESIVGEQYPQIVAQNKSSDLKLPIRHIQTGTSDLIDESERPSLSGGSGGSYFPLMGGTSKGTEQENPVEQSRNSRGDFQNGDENREISESILGQQSPTLTIQNKPYDQLPPVRHNQTTTSKSINETTLLERPKKPNVPTLSVEHKESSIIRPDDQLRISEGNLIEGKENNEMIESIVGEQYPLIVGKNISSDLKFPIRHIQTGTSELTDESEWSNLSGSSGGSHSSLMGGQDKRHIKSDENQLKRSECIEEILRTEGKHQKELESTLGEQPPQMVILNKSYDQDPPVEYFDSVQTQNNDSEQHTGKMNREKSNAIFEEEISDHEQDDFPRGHSGETTEWDQFKSFGSELSETDHIVGMPDDVQKVMNDVPDREASIEIEQSDINNFNSTEHNRHVEYSELSFGRNSDFSEDLFGAETPLIIGRNNYNHMKSDTKTVQKSKANTTSQNDVHSIPEVNPNSDSSSGQAKQLKNFRRFLTGKSNTEKFVKSNEDDFLEQDFSGGPTVKKSQNSPYLDLDHSGDSKNMDGLYGGPNSTTNETSKLTCNYTHECLSSNDKEILPHTTEDNHHNLRANNYIVPTANLESYPVLQTLTNQNTGPNPCFYPSSPSIQTSPYKLSVASDPRLMNIVASPNKPQSMPLYLINPPIASYVAPPAPVLVSNSGYQQPNQNYNVYNNPAPQKTTVQMTGPGGQFYMCTTISAPNNNIVGFPGLEVRNSNFEEELGALVNNRTQLRESADCPLGFSSCADGSRCIKDRHICDNEVHCEDASDEISCTCKQRVGALRQCDGFYDCPNGEDEEGCFGCSHDEFSCDDWSKLRSGTCIPKEQRCDGIRHCEVTGKDEEDCVVLTDRVGQGGKIQVSHSVGYLHRNFKGKWYPTCLGTDIWAMDVCRMESGPSDTIPKTHMMLTLEQYGGNFLSLLPDNRISVVSTCIQDRAAFVECPPLFCGLRIMTRNPYRPTELDTSIEDEITNMKRNIYRPHKNSKLPKVLRDDSNEERIFNEEQDIVGESRVVGGRASQPASWPWVVSIYKNGIFLCGGVLINEIWVLTAAHCLERYWQYYYEVEFGVLRRFSYSPMEQSRFVVEAIPHREYDRSNLGNDIALMKLSAPVRFNRYVRPICLPSEITAGLNFIKEPQPGTICTTVGWGATVEHGVDPDHMREVEVPVLERCKHLEDVLGHEICAGLFEGGRDACQGDSGGPLMCRSPNNPSQWYLAGIVSHGEGCGRAEEPGVYTRVSLYLGWIAEHMREGNRLRRLPLKTCPGYRCKITNRCLPKKRRCDKIVDCLLGDDEVNCEKSLHNILKEALFLTSPRESLSSTRDDLLDLSKDATKGLLNDAEDEILGMTIDKSIVEVPDEPKYFRCERMLQAIPEQKRCNRAIDCEDGSDEMECSCVDYIRKSYPEAVCDGITDCYDRSDEDGCSTCSPEQYYCQVSRTCIDKSKRCNGVADCAKQEDEIDCVALTDGSTLTLDSDLRPRLSMSGIITINRSGVWRPLCTNMSDNHATVATNVCNLLGFEEYTGFYKFPLEDKPVSVKMHGTERTDLPDISDNMCSGLYVRCSNVSLDNIVHKVYQNNITTSIELYTSPWNAAIYSEGKYKCMGAILDTRWIVTSLKCFQGILMIEFHYISVVLGKGKTHLDVYGPHEQIIPVVKSIQVADSDIVLLYLERSILYSRYVKPTHLKPRMDTPYNHKCVAAGIDSGKTVFQFYTLSRNCTTGYHCFKRASEIHQSCKNNDPWRGIIVCDSRSGWYPVATFEEQGGICHLQKIVKYPSIRSKITEILEIIRNNQSLPQRAECDGFRCPLGNCISHDKICNGIADCINNDDEEEKLCSEKDANCSLSGTCGCKITDLKCATGKCIPKEKFCDGNNDCGDYSDEPAVCTCRSYLALTNSTKLCDGTVNCEDRTDEDPELCTCSPKDVRCGVSKYCVSPEMICDGYEDCPRGEDESACYKLDAYTKRGTKGEVLQRTAGIWHAGCFSQYTSTEFLQDICKTLGFSGEYAGRLSNHVYVSNSTALYPVIDKFSVVWIYRTNGIKKLKVQLRTGNEPYVTFEENNDCHRLFIECK